MAILKGDCRSLADLPACLTFEQFVSAFLDIRDRLECPSGWQLELLREFANHKGNIGRTAQSLGRPEQAHRLKCRLQYMARKYGTRSLKRFLIVVRVYIGACRKLRWQMDYHCDRLSAWRDFGFNCKLAALECQAGTASAFRHYIRGLKREFGFAA